MGRMKDLLIDDSEYELDYDNYVEYPVEIQMVFDWWVDWIFEETTDDSDDV